MSYSFTGRHSLEARRVGFAAQREEADARLAELPHSFLIEHIGAVRQDRAGRVSQKDRQRPLASSGLVNWVTIFTVRTSA